ncbi:MAG: AmmeMemoRadiSam system radical SAM enzyme [Planctomycetota bacterium]|jgi:pyruvate formate lyase activating enzyme
MDRPEGEALNGGATAPPERRITRRRLLACGAAGAVAACGGAFLIRTLLRSAREEAGVEVFAGGAPADALWEAWKKRGWAKEARHCRKLGANVQCRLCPNNCLLAPGDRGRCRNRVNKDGTLYTLAYGNPCSFHVDPVEKKPLYHFLPGDRTFSVATSGCGFRCLNCQNWEISQRKPEETKDAGGESVRLNPDTLERLRRADMARLSMFPEDVVALAEHLSCTSIAYTYSEPTAFFEYMVDTARLARRHKLSNIWVTCGYIGPEALDELCTVIDAANVDLKSFSDAIYRKLNSGRLQPILDTLVTLKRRGVWFEVTNLVVPTYTDDLEMIKRMCGWLLANIGPDYPLHFSRFHPAHKLTHLPPTPPDVLHRARSIARKQGLRHVYIGNLRGVKDAETTFCPACGKPVVERRIYSIYANHVTDGQCTFCGEPIAGVWSRLVQDAD